ncbi:MAG TPA: hypothetical protein VF540_07430, partial [Segetibacter sp.]
ILVDKDEKDYEFKEIKTKIRSVLFDLELKVAEVITGVVMGKFFWKDKLSESPLYWEVEKDGMLL